jgi:hypothetical protein
MSIKKNKKLNTRVKKILIGIFLLILFALISLKLFGLINLSPTNNGDTTNADKASEIDAANKQKFIENQLINETTNNNTEPSVSTSDNIIILTSRESDGSITITTRLSQYSDGTCDLTISNNGQTHTQSATVIYQPEFSTCAGFNVPLGALGAGNWQISLTVSSKGISNIKTAQVEIR